MQLEINYFNFYIDKIYYLYYLKGEVILNETTNYSMPKLQS